MDSISLFCLLVTLCWKLQIKMNPKCIWMQRLKIRFGVIETRSALSVLRLQIHLIWTQWFSGARQFCGRPLSLFYANFLRRCVLNCYIFWPIHAFTNLILLSASPNHFGYDSFVYAVNINGFNQNSLKWTFLKQETHEFERRKNKNIKTHL